MGCLVAIVVIVVLIAAAANDDVDQAVTGGLNVAIVIALIAGGVSVWTKFRQSTEKAEKAIRAKAVGAIDAEMRQWRYAGEGTRRRRPKAPPPISPRLDGDIGPGLPTSDKARRVIRDAAAALARSVAEEARQYANAVSPPTERLCVPGKYREEDHSGWGPLHGGSRPTETVFELVADVFAWADARQVLLSGVHEEAARLLGETAAPLKDMFAELRSAYRRVGDGAGIPVHPTGEWETFLGELHSALTTTADQLFAVPPPALLPLVHRPDEGSLRDDTTTQAMTEHLGQFISRTTVQYEAAKAGAWPGPFGADWRLDGGVLDGFLTKYVRELLARATQGFYFVARWTPRDIAPECHSRIYLAYVAIALNYLMEVRGHMDKYAQPKPGDRITVTVGNMSHSNVNVQSTVRDIITTLGPVADRGDTDLADAIKALTEAVRQDPDLAEDNREELLHHVEDIAEAAAEPQEGRKKSRAKAAWNAITEATRNATQLAETVGTLQDAIGKLF